MAAAVRPFMAEDARAVANLFFKVFLRSQAAAPDTLVDYLREIFCRHPWADSELSSLVYAQADGSISGFIGIYPVPMIYRGRRLRAAFAGNLMADPSLQDPLAGARLLRSFLSGPQDLSLTETTNQISMTMWRKLGGQVVANRSLNWIRVLRPMSWLVTAAARRAPWFGLLRGPASLFDMVSARRLAPQSAPNSSGEDVDPSALSPIVRDIAQSFALHPDFDEAALAFLLEHAARKERYGELIARIVHSRRGQPIGGYVAHGRPNDTLRVVQIFTSAANADPVVADLFSRAAAMGAAAVNGRTQPEIIPSLLSAQYLFAYSGGATLVHGRDPELLAAVHGPDNFLNGLAGETWARLIGGAFDEGVRLPRREASPLENLSFVKLRRLSRSR